MKPSGFPQSAWRSNILTGEDTRLGKVLLRAAERLKACSETPRADAQVLLGHILAKNRAWLAAHPEHRLSPDGVAKVEAAILRLERGDPLPYVLGVWEFYGLEFEVNLHVLIPRPETELLVERALDWLRQNPARRRVADVGTGSGCIAVSLAAHLKDLQILATDISAEALQVAQRNANSHGVGERISFAHADLLPGGAEAFDLVCANLPYIPTEKLRTLEVYGHEPNLALDGGPDGLSLIRRLLAQASQRISPGGLFLLEIEETTGSLALEAARRVFPYAQIQILPDLAGRDRLLEIQR